MLRKLIPIMLAALLLLSVSGCGKSAENDNITVMNTTTENTEAPESVITSSEEAVTDDPYAGYVNTTTENTEAPESVPTSAEEAVTDDPYAGYVKEDYQDPGEFIFGIQHIIQASATVEEMNQALAEFDSEGRIDRVLLSFDGVPVTEGEIRQGMRCEVYYDNEISWFEFHV